MEESNKTPNPQPIEASVDYAKEAERVREEIVEYEDKLLMEGLNEYEELLRTNRYPRGNEFDGWREAYLHIKEVERSRDKAYEQARLNIALFNCRDSLKEEGEMILSSPKGERIKMGRVGKDWLLERIENYFDSSEWYVPYYFIYDDADYCFDEDEEGGGYRVTKTKEEFLKNNIALQAKFVSEYEELRGDGRGLFAKHLGMYVVFAMERVPEWAASLTDNEKYRFIGDMMEMAGVLERYRGKEWMRNRWYKMDKKEKANQIKQWAAAARKK